uniref:Tudor domain-containing protein n=1 Tax=Leersia perrieri TaxID=77586 RepID=A0A0D9W3H3_9ORYZ
MESDAAELEMKRQLRDIGARLTPLPDDDEQLLRLLQEAAALLYRVNQYQSDSMHSALIPVMKVLIKKELLDHTNSGMKLAVASCLTALIRIRAPEGPYDDDVMKVDVLKLVVEAFCKLDDVECPSYGTRVSMLATFAAVRGYTLLLDLDCNDLIRDMFRHFFRTITNAHQENVISYMETIMKFTIEETTDMEQNLIQDLASCLLQNVKKEEKETLPASFVLAERVIGLCHEKLRPVFIELLQGSPANEYSSLITSLVQDAEDNNIDAFMHDLEAVSPEFSTMMSKPNGQPADSGEELHSKDVQETKEAFNSKKKALGGSIVGSRIKVWWSGDEMFYNGFVKSFDASLGTHEIVYDDGDVEWLPLKNEKWQFISEEEDYNPDASANMPQDRSDKGNFDQPFQDTLKAASNYSSIIEEKCNSVLNEIQCLYSETTSAFPVRISGWENCHLEPEKVTVESQHTTL